MYNDKSNTPLVCSNIISQIFKTIESKKINLEKHCYIFSVTVSAPTNLKYDAIAISAIERTFKPYGWNCKLRLYKEFNDKIGYLFRFEKSKSLTSDLPF